jgi:hypothetical protein
MRRDWRQCRWEAQPYRVNVQLDAFANVYQHLPNSMVSRWIIPATMALCEPFVAELWLQGIVWCDNSPHRSLMVP